MLTAYAQLVKSNEQHVDESVNATWSDDTLKRLAKALLDVRLRSAKYSKADEFKLIQDMALTGSECRRLESSRSYWTRKIWPYYLELQAEMHNKALEQVVSSSGTGVPNPKVVASVSPVVTPSPEGSSNTDISEIQVLTDLVKGLTSKVDLILSGLSATYTALTHIANNGSAAANSAPFNAAVGTASSDVPQPQVQVPQPATPTPTPIATTFAPSPYAFVRPNPGDKIRAIVFGWVDKSPASHQIRSRQKIFDNYDIRWVSHPSSSFPEQCRSVEVIFYCKAMTSNRVLTQLHASKATVIGVEKGMDKLEIAALQYFANRIQRN